MKIQKQFLNIALEFIYKTFDLILIFSFYRIQYILYVLYCIDINLRDQKILLKNMFEQFYELFQFNPNLYLIRYYKLFSYIVQTNIF